MKKFRAPKVRTVVGTNTEVKGDITFSGGLHIDGTVKGDVIGDQDTTSAVTLSELGTIEGNVRVANVIVNGSVKGDVHALQRLELAPKAKIAGTVYYRFLEMSMGAEVNGKLVHTEEDRLALACDDTIVSAKGDGDIEVVPGVRGINDRIAHGED